MRTLQIFFYIFFWSISQIVNPCYISAHSVDQLFFFNSRSYKNDLNTCIITNYTYFINTKLRSTRKITAKYPNYPTNYQNDILSVQEKKDDPSNLCKTIYANTICHSIFIVWIKSDFFNFENEYNITSKTRKERNYQNWI